MDFDSYKHERMFFTYRARPENVLEDRTLRRRTTRRRQEILNELCRGKERPHALWMQAHCRFRDEFDIDFVPQQPVLWTQRSFAFWMGVSRETVRSWIYRGLLPVVFHNRRRWIRFGEETVALLMRHAYLQEMESSEDEDDQSILRRLRHAKPYFFRFPSWVRKARTKTHPVFAAWNRALHEAREDLQERFAGNPPGDNFAWTLAMYLYDEPTEGYSIPEDKRAKVGKFWRFLCAYDRAALFEVLSWHSQGKKITPEDPFLAWVQRTCYPDFSLTSLRQKYRTALSFLEREGSKATAAIKKRSEKE